MNRLIVVLGVALAVAAVPAAPAAAQTRVAVEFGFGTPRPEVGGLIVVGPRYEYEAEPEVFRPAPRRYWHRYPYGWERREYRSYRHHRRHGEHREYDDEDGGE